MANEIQKIKRGKNGIPQEITAPGIRLNNNGNREFYSEGLNTKNPPEPQKINISSVGDIQVKTGNNSVLQLDCENNSSTGSTANQNEYQIKICNGSFNKSKRVVGAKVNVAEVIFDNQNANTDEFDNSEIRVKYRHDKANEAVYAKHMAASFDFRCVQRDGDEGRAHGGIALQIAGADGDGSGVGSSHENKIKFESNRTTAVTATPAYSGNGGDGLEFGTFNNEHSSLFSKDYRFNTDGKVYPSTRTITTTSGKTDYVTQSDDFKDIIDSSRCATWGKIVDVAQAANTNAVGCLDISGSGNVRVSSYGKYSYEANFVTKDENGADVSTGYKAVSFVNESYYTDTNKYCYVAGKNAKRSDGTTSVSKDKIILWSDASVYLTNQTIIDSFLVDANDENYYATNDKWTKKTFWEKNDANVNIESTSKIKLQGEKLEVLNEVNGIEEKMASVSIDSTEFDLNSTSMFLDASTIDFERKITKNGDESGHDPVITYTFTNNVADTSKVANLAAFIANYQAAHPQPWPSSAELETMYNNFVAQGPSVTYSVKLSELLSLVNRVAALES